MLFSSSAIRAADGTSGPPSTSPYLGDAVGEHDDWPHLGVDFRPAEGAQLAAPGAGDHGDPDQRAPVGSLDASVRSSPASAGEVWPGFGLGCAGGSALSAG